MGDPGIIAQVAGRKLEESRQHVQGEAANQRESPRLNGFRHLRRAFFLRRAEDKKRAPFPPGFQFIGQVQKIFQGPVLGPPAAAGMNGPGPDSRPFPRFRYAPGSEDPPGDPGRWGKGPFRRKPRGRPRSIKPSAARPVRILSAPASGKRGSSPPKKSQGFSDFESTTPGAGARRYRPVRILPEKDGTAPEPGLPPGTDRPSPFHDGTAGPGRRNAGDSKTRLAVFPTRVQGLSLWKILSE